MCKSQTSNDVSGQKKKRLKRKGRRRKKKKCLIGGAPFVRMESVRIGVLSFLHFVRIKNRPLLELVQKTYVSAFCQNSFLMKKGNFYLLSEKYTELPFVRISFLTFVRIS